MMKAHHHLVSIWAIVSCSLVFSQQSAKPAAGVDPVLSELISRCAPSVHPETMAAVVSAESRGHQFAIADAGPANLPWAQRKNLVRSLYPPSLDEAVRTAKQLIANGHTVSLGFAQVNDRNLRALGLTVGDVFDPCTNLAAGSKILSDFYARASVKFKPGARALRAAISAYNSGDWVRGEKDGYVDLVYRQVGVPLSIQTAGRPERRSQATKTASVPAPVAATKGFAMSVTVFPASENTR